MGGNPINLFLSSLAFVTLVIFPVAELPRCHQDPFFPSVVEETLSFNMAAWLPPIPQRLSSDPKDGKEGGVRH